MGETESLKPKFVYVFKQLLKGLNVQGIILYKFMDLIFGVTKYKEGRIYNKY